MRRYNRPMPQPKITAMPAPKMPVPVVPQWITDGLSEYSPQQPFNTYWSGNAATATCPPKREEAHTNNDVTCHYVENIKHPTKCITIGLCECGQHWTNEGGTLKAITRLKYQTVSTEIAELQEAEKRDAKRRAENILGPDIADGMDQGWHTPYNPGQRGTMSTYADMEDAYEEALRGLVKWDQEYDF